MTARERAGERGLTLVELLIAMLLLGLVLFMVVGFFSSANRAFTQSNAVGGNTKAASNGMNEISRILRAATQNPVQGQALSSPAFVPLGTAGQIVTGNETVTVYAYVNLDSATEQPVKVQFSLDSNRNLIETKWAGYVISPGYWGFQSTPVSTRIFAATVVNRTGSNPYLFTYLKTDGTALTVPAGGFSDSDLRSIAAVQVTLGVGTSATVNSSTVVLQNTVGLPNIGLSRTS
jgi:prepilin-type N-terminal cleavage/methylation domain-containing protein